MKKTQAAQAVQQALPEEAKKPVAPSTVTAAPTKAEKLSNVLQHPAVLVFDGGKQQINVATVPQVHPADIEQAGISLKRLAFNVMTDNVDPALMDRDAPFWKLRTLKDTKTAFFGLMNVKGANGKSGGQIIRERWNAECAAKVNNERARIAQVSLNGLWKLFKPAREGSGAGNNPVQRVKESFRTFIEEVEAIISAKASPKHKFEMIAEKCEQALEKLEGKKDE